MNNSNFFADNNYKMPSTENYMKFKEGDNTFRVLSSAITGYEYFTTDNKPVRSKLPFDETPGIKQKKNDKTGELQDEDVRHFWAFCVWNYNDERVQILQLTQTGIMTFMQNLVQNGRWGNPQGYDITVTRKGSALNTEYTYIANPHSVLEDHIAEAWSKAKIDLNELYAGGDPFKPKNLDKLPEVKVDLDDGSVPNPKL